MQEVKGKPVYVVKIKGSSKAFIDDIVSTLKNCYYVVYVSQPRANSDNTGYHVFVDLLEGREP
jgi:hypothetical protein